jgi:hypothetical protein
MPGDQSAMPGQESGRGNHPARQQLAAEQVPVVVDQFAASGAPR